MDQQPFVVVPTTAFGGSTKDCLDNQSLVIVVQYQSLFGSTVFCDSTKDYLEQQSLVVVSKTIWITVFGGSTKDCLSRRAKSLVVTYVLSSVIFL